MPTYDYRCKACKHEFEQFQSMKDEPLKTCPACKKKQLERLIGAGAGLIFKGSGFYITDYRSESYKQAAKSDSGDSGASSGGDAKPAAASSSDAKSDAKPAAAEPKPAPKAEPKAAPKPEPKPAKAAAKPAKKA